MLFSHHDSASPYSTKTVHAQSVKRTFSPASRKGWAFPVETRKDDQNASHYFVDIDNSGSGEVIQVAYISIDFQPSPLSNGRYWVHGLTINNTNVSSPTIVRTGVAGVYMSAPAVAGSNNGRAQVVWSEDKVAGTGDRYILGKRLAPYWVNRSCIFNEN